MSAETSLWGTFSVADHLPVHSLPTFCSTTGWSFLYQMANGDPALARDSQASGFTVGAAGHNG